MVGLVEGGDQLTWQPGITLEQTLMHHHCMGDWEDARAVKIFFDRFSAAMEDASNTLVSVAKCYGYVGQKKRIEFACDKERFEVFVLQCQLYVRGYVEARALGLGGNPMHCCKVYAVAFL